MVVSAILALLALAGSDQDRSQAVSVAQTPVSVIASQDPVTEVDSIDVVGRRNSREQMIELVETLSAPPRRQGLARWDREICVGVANMPSTEAQRMIDRVSQLAQYVGLGVGQPGCRADVLIVATPEADALANELVTHNLDVMRPSLGGTDLGRTALETFRTTDAPVRWWHVSLPVSVDTGAVAVQLKGAENAPEISSPNMSRLRSGIRYDLAKVIVIIDTQRLGQVSFSALSDYVAMVALAQIDPTADVSAYPSVLNTFGPSGGSGLTELDAGYLRSLYNARRDYGMPSAQINQMASALSRRSQTGTEPTP